MTASGVHNKKIITGKEHRLYFLQRRAYDLSQKIGYTQSQYSHSSHITHLEPAQSSSVAYQGTMDQCTALTSSFL